MHGSQSGSYGRWGRVGRDELASTTRSPVLMGGVVFLLFSLCWLSRSNYLLFHVTIELFSIAVAWALALLVWNTRRLVSDYALLFLGIAYAFVGIVDLFHTLAYMGMGLFPEAGANLSTQLLIAARSLESLSLLAFAVCLGRSVQVGGVVVVGGYAIVTVALLSAVFLGIFPDCFIEGAGLTPFKVISEYVISLTLAGSAILIWRKRAAIDRGVLWMILAAIALTIAGELAFTFYISVYGISNLAGHFLKFISFLLVYLALIHTGIRQPYSTLFRDLALSERKFRFSFNRSPLLMGIVSTDTGICVDVNETFLTTTGNSREEVVGARAEALGFLAKESLRRIRQTFLKNGHIELMEVEVCHKDGGRLTCLLEGEVIRTDRQSYLLAMATDITRQKQAEAERKITLELLQTINEQTTVQGLTREISQRLAAWADMEAVAIRLKDGEDYPYAGSFGFPAAFTQAENRLCARDTEGKIIRDPDGNAELECMCGNIVCGRLTPEQPIFTESGSFFTNSTTVLQASTSEADRQAGTRNRCNSAGYESVALIPLRYGEEILGLLQLNDKRRDKFSEESIAFLEQLAGNLAVALKGCREREMAAQERALMTAMLSSTPDLFALKDATGVLRMVNPAFSRFLGKHQSEIVGRTMLELFPPEDAERYAASDREVIATGQTDTYEAEVLGKDGRVWLHVHKTAVLDQGGNATGVLSSMRNISDRKRTESLLEARLRIRDYANSRPLEHILEQVLDEAETLTASEIAFIHYLDEAEKEISLQQWSSRTKSGLCSLKSIEQHYPLQQAGVWVDSIRQRKPLIVNDYKNIPNKKGTPTGHVQLTRFLTVPVFSGKNVVAILGVGNKQTDYTDEDVEIINVLANIAWDLAGRKIAEEKLHESLQQQVRLMNNLPGMVYRCAYDELWTMEFLSNGCKAITGYEPDALIQNRDVTYHDLIIPGHRQKVWSTVQAAVASQTSFELEYAIRHRDGTSRWVLEKGRLVESETENRVHIEGFISDITEQKKTKEQIYMQARVLDQISDRVTVTDLDGYITYVNKAGAAVWKRPQRWFVGLNIRLVLGRLLAVNSLEEVLERIITNGSWKGELIDFETDGSEVFLDVRANVIRDEEGEDVALCCVASDLTAMKQHEFELRRLSRAIDQAAEIIVITDAEGQIQYVNPSFSAATGYSREEVIGERPRLLKSGMHDDSYYQDMWNDLTAGRIWHGNIINRKKDGSLYTQKGKISPVRDDSGKTVNFVAVMQDITDELELHARLSNVQRLEAIGTLAGGIAHDFNNILFPIVGLAELLREDLTENSSQQDQVAGILESAKRAAELVKQILAFSREGDHELKPVRVQLIVKEIVKLTKATLPSTIHVKESIDQNCPLILADATQIHQVVMNLVTNAFHAMEEKGGLLSVSLQATMLERQTAQTLDVVPGRFICLTVADTGCGIDPAVLPQIYDPYFTTKSKGKGTGLGLSVSHGIIKKFGGGIEVETRKDAGTTFKVYLPGLHEDEVIEQYLKADKLPGGDERVLLVDDEQQVVSVLKRMLERLGYRVTFCTSSVEALELYRDDPEQFDLVISDLTMPKMTGDRLAVEIKRLRPKIPVIVFTGFSEKMNEEKCRLLGIDGYLLKPVLRQQLAEVVRKVLDS